MFNGRKIIKNIIGKDIYSKQNNLLNSQKINNMLNNKNNLRNYFDWLHYNESKTDLQNELTKYTKRDLHNLGRDELEGLLFEKEYKSLNKHEIMQMFRDNNIEENDVIRILSRGTR